MISEYHNKYARTVRNGVYIVALAASLATTIANADEYAPAGFGGYLFGGSPINLTGVTVEGFAYYFDGLHESNVVNIQTGTSPSYYPDAYAHEMSQSDDLMVLWQGSTTAPNSIGTFFVEFNNEWPLSGDAAWQNQADNGYLEPIEPSYIIVGPDWNLIYVGTQQYVSVSLGNLENVDVWVQRRVNRTSDEFELKALAQDDRVWNGGTLLDANPIFVPKGNTVVHRESLDPSVGNYLLTYDVFENRRGQPGQHIGTFFSAIEITNDTE